MGREEGSVLVVTGFIRGMSLSIACGRVVKRGVLPVFVLCHCYDGEEVMYAMYLDDERGQVVLSHQSSYIYWYCTVTQ